MVIKSVVLCFRLHCLRKSGHKPIHELELLGLIALHGLQHPLAPEVSQYFEQTRQIHRQHHSYDQPLWEEISSFWRHASYHLSVGSFLVAFCLSRRYQGPHKGGIFLCSIPITILDIFSLFSFTISCGGSSRRT